MSELLVFVPAAVGVVADRAFTLLFMRRHRPEWKAEVKVDAEFWSGAFGILKGLDAVTQARLQVDDINSLKDIPEQIVSGRLAWLKAVAGLALLTATAVNVQNEKLFTAFGFASIAVPFLLGAVVDGIKSKGALHPELVFDMNLP